MNVHRCRFVDYTPHTITAICFLNEKCLALGRSNGDIEIWNPTNWIQEQTLRGGKGRSIESLEWAVSDGVPRLFSVGGSTAVTEWNLSTGQPLAHHDCHSGVIWSLTVSSDNSKLAVGCDNGSVTVIGISGGRGVMEHLRILQRCNARVMSLSYKGNRQILGGCSDGKLRIWSTESELNGRIVATMRVDKSKTDETLVWAVLTLRDGKILVSGDSTGSVKIWDGSNHSLLQSFKIHEADVLCLAADSAGDRIFSGGVDRKIVQYRLVDSKLKKYTNIGSRLVHAHDIRAMDTCSESLKGKGLIVSGGVEKTIVLNSIKDFPDGMYRKVPITRHTSVVGLCVEPRLAYLWADQTVKIWKIDEYFEPEVADNLPEEKGSRLVSKITVANEENITYCDISSDGSHLAVATLAEVKLFELSPSSTNSLRVNKISSTAIANLGARLIKFIPASNQLILVTAHSEVYLYGISNDEVIELDTSDHTSPIFHLTISPSGRYAACGSLGGQIDIFDLSSFSLHGSLPKSNQTPTAMRFTNDDTLIVVTVNFRILEFSPAELSLTAWSRRNWDVIPKELTGQVDRCTGIFVDQTDSKRVWLWGASWLGYVDRSLDLPNERALKRKLDSELGTVDGDEEEAANRKRKAFYLSNKYRPILFADSLGPGELFVCERPAFDISLPAAFWSNHKIVL